MKVSMQNQAQLATSTMSYGGQFVEDLLVLAIDFSKPRCKRTTQPEVLRRAKREHLCVQG